MRNGSAIAFVMVLKVGPSPKKPHSGSVHGIFGMLGRMKLSTVLRRVTLLLLFIATSSLTLLAQEPSIYIKAGKLFDGS